MAPVSTSLFNWQLFKKLIVACQESNPAGKVDACAFVPLLCDVFTRSNAAHPFDTERREVPQDSELVRTYFVFSTFLHQIVFDLLAQHFLRVDFFLCFRIRPHNIKQSVNILLLSL